MKNNYHRGNRALKSLGNIVTDTFNHLENLHLDKSKKDIFKDLVGEMGKAINERNLEEAKKITGLILSDVLGYEKARASFIVNNYLNKNSGWGEDN